MLKRRIYDDGHPSLVLAFNNLAEIYRDLGHNDRAATVFAEDFATEVTGIAAGVLHHEDSVFATIAPDVWRLRDRVCALIRTHWEVEAAQSSRRLRLERRRRAQLREAETVERLTRGKPGTAE